MALRQVIIDYTEMHNFADPVFYINAKLLNNGFNLQNDFIRQDDFCNHQIIYTQEVSNG